MDNRLFSVFFFIVVVFSGAACAQQNLVFQPVFNKQKMEFGKEYISLQNDTIVFSKIRMYLSDFEIYYNDGNVFKESNSNHLLEWSNSKVVNSLLLPIDTTKKIDSISYQIGVDSLTNVSGAFDGDLDPALGMYWAWQSGYINFKIEGKSSSCSTHHNEFSFHIGGYNFPNNASQLVRHEGKFSSNFLVNIDLSKFFGEIDLSINNSVLIPCREAVEIAYSFSKCFIKP